MSIALINASPKQAESASEMLLGELKGLLPADCGIQTFSIHKPSIHKVDIEQLLQFDTWVFAFPLYADAIPSHLLSVMRTLETNKMTAKEIYVYAIVNLGFYEGRQAKNALAIIENWCDKSGLKWGGGVGLGGGGALASIKNVQLGHGPKTSLGKALSAFSEAIRSNSLQENSYVSIDLPKFLYKYMGEMGWRRMIKANGGRTKDLHKKI